MSLFCESEGELPLSQYPVHYVKSLRVHFLIWTVSVENSIPQQAAAPSAEVQGYSSQANSLFKNAPQ